MTRRTVWIIFFLSCGLGAAALLASADVHLPGNDIGYAPKQPIAFSHRLHAGELQVDCLYCHSGAEKSRHAGIPALGVCMNCHKTVKAPISEVRAEAAAAKADWWALASVSCCSSSSQIAINSSTFAMMRRCSARGGTGTRNSRSLRILRPSRETPTCPLMIES